MMRKCYSVSRSPINENDDIKSTSWIVYHHGIVAKLTSVAVFEYFSGVFNFCVPQLLQPYLYSYRDTGCIKIFVMSRRIKYATIGRYSGSFLISFYSANVLNLITVMRPYLHFSCLELHRNFNILNSCTNDAFYYSFMCRLSYMSES